MEGLIAMKAVPSPYEAPELYDLVLTHFRENLPSDRDPMMAFGWRA